MMAKLYCYKRTILSDKYTEVYDMESFFRHLNEDVKMMGSFVLMSPPFVCQLSMY